ncbi:MAG TPA: hypothetical protein VHW00_00880 [Thermoanaerobaculia bacterium]|nr:hypothetical protein [Thermoanaerobaculia bacterium]
MKRLALAVACLALAPHLQAQLTKANVTAAQLSAITGTARVTDLESSIWTSGKLRSRVYRGESGTPAANLYVYEYSIDLRDVVGITSIPFLSSMSVDFGPILGTLDFNADRKADQMFVVKGLGLGNVAPSSATKSGNLITFVFDPPVGGGSAPGNGDRTYVFGVLSKYPPRQVAATAQHNLGGAALSLKVQAPDWP